MRAGSDLTLLPRGKDFSLLSGQAPLYVHGPVRDLALNVDMSRLITSLLSPIELGLTDAADCRRLTEAMRRG